MIQPPWLKPGDKITLLAPSGRIDPDISLQAKSYLEHKGYRVELLPSATGAFNYFSDTPEQRLNDLQSALDDPDCRAILCARGGYGAIHLLDKLNWEGFIMNPKWMVGFSDITILHAELNKMNTCSLHSGMAKDLQADDETANRILQVLGGQANIYTWQSTSGKSGKVSAALVGGNLSVLVSLAGTPYFPDVKGKILFIEDIGEYLYKIDRMLWTLKLKGVFDQIAGLVIGHFTDIGDTTTPYGSTLQEIILKMVSDQNYPVTFDFPCGHEDENLPIVLGAKVELEVKETEASMRFLYG